MHFSIVHTTDNPTNETTLETLLDYISDYKINQTTDHTTKNGSRLQIRLHNIDQTAKPAQITIYTCSDYRSDYISWTTDQTTYQTTKIDHIRPNFARLAINTTDQTTIFLF